MNRTVCVHQVNEISNGMLPDFHIVGRTTTRSELLTAITATDIAIVVLDLDSDGALATIYNLLEAKPQTGIVGVTGTTDLNHVIAAQRAGCGQIATRPIDANDLAAAVRRSLNQGTAETPAARTLAVFGTTGGAGATTIACHLAVELANQTSDRTALIDLDLDFGGVARAFDLQPTFTVSDLASSGASDALLLSKTAVALPGGVDVFARPPNIREAHAIDENAVRSIIKLAGQSYRYVVLDLPRRLDAITGTALELANELLVIVQLTVPSVDNTRRLIDSLQAEGFPLERLMVLVNRYRKSVHSCTAEMVEKELKQKIFAVVPSDYASVHHAIDTGKPLAEKNPVRAAIAELASKLLGQDAQPARKSGWLASLGIGRRPVEKTA